METTIQPLIHSRILSALTQYDMREEKKALARGYSPNIYALGLYCQALQRAEDQMKSGATLRSALCQNFIGRLLAAVLKAAGEAKPTKEELNPVIDWWR